MIFSVLDIEATGGKLGEERVIDVAIYKYDGNKIIDQFFSLVNPERSIDEYVQKLTNITSKMVKTAPKFYELGKRIIEMTEGTVLVGHNIDFDYRMLKQEFRRLGYDYYRETLDTVELSEKLIPEAPSYSLEKLCKSLGIPVADRHRASGDAMATLKLFQILKDKDTEKSIEKIERKTKKKKTGLKTFEFAQDLPHKVGIYYLYNKNDELIYLARSEDIALSVHRIFMRKTNLFFRIRQQVAKVTYELTGTDIISWIKERNELQKNTPSYNKTVQKESYRYGIYFTKEDGMNAFYVDAIPLPDNKEDKLLLGYTSKKKAVKSLSLISEEYNLCPKIERHFKNSGIPEMCMSYQVGECLGVCFGAETEEEYNKRTQKIIDKLNYHNFNIVLVYKGRKPDEKSFLWVKNGECKGYGYFELHHQILSESKLEKIMTPVEDNEELSARIKHSILFGDYERLEILLS